MSKYIIQKKKAEKNILLNDNDNDGLNDNDVQRIIPSEYNSSGI